jgi:hypothetical protein
VASFPLPFPVTRNASERFTLERRQSTTESPFNYKVQVVQTASRWTIEWTWPRMSVPKAEAIVGWSLKLKGMIGTFKFYPNRTIVSQLVGRSLAIIGFAYNDTVSIGGWTAGQLSTLRVGQWFTIGDQLLQITDAGAVADSAGKVTVSFQPELRKDYPLYTPVEFVKPYGVFRMSKSESLAYTLDPDRRPDFGTCQAREDV